MSAEARREEIVSAALYLAARQGAEKTTTQDMAEAVGVTQGAIFRHFPTKDAIWVAAIEWVRSQVMRVVMEAAALGADPLDSLEKVFYAHVAFVAKHPGIPRLLFSELRNSRDTSLKQVLQELMSGYERKIVSILQDAKRADLVEPDLDEAGAATLFLGMIQGLVMQAQAFGAKRQLVAQAQKAFPIYLKGVRIRDQHLLQSPSALPATAPIDSASKPVSADRPKATGGRDLN